eukprot:s1_g1557.t1
MDTLSLRGEKVPLVVRHNPRARRLIVRVDMTTGAVHVTTPNKRNVKAAISFAHSHSDWLIEQRKHVARAEPFCDGAFVPVRGTPHRIRHVENQRCAVQQIEPQAGNLAELHVGGDISFLPRRVTDWLKHQAKSDLNECVLAHAAKLNVRPSRVTVRDQTSRWGSCRPYAFVSPHLTVSNRAGTDENWESVMVSDRMASDGGDGPGNSGFSGGMVAASFVGALGALILVIGAEEVLDTESDTDTAGGAFSLTVPASGTEEMVTIGTAATSATLTFEETGTYRVELRGLDGTSDPVLALYAANSDTATVTNDDTDGLDAIVPVTVAESTKTWRVELTSYGETGGPGVLRVLPAPDGFVGGTVSTDGPGGFPEGEIATLELDNAATSSLDADGSWYQFSPAESGRHVISVRAADESLDTVAHLLPVLPGADVPSAGTDIASMTAAFTSDDDDGLNPRFERYLQEGATYYLFVRGFDETAEGSFAVTASFLGDNVTTTEPDEPAIVEEDADDVPEDQDLPSDRSDSGNGNKN